MTGRQNCRKIRICRAGRTRAGCFGFAPKLLAVLPPRACLPKSSLLRRLRMYWRDRHEYWIETVVMLRAGFWTGRKPRYGPQKPPVASTLY